MKVEREAVEIVRQEGDQARGWEPGTLAQSDAPSAPQGCGLSSATPPDGRPPHPIEVEGLGRIVGLYAIQAVRSNVSRAPHRPASRRDQLAQGWRSAATSCRPGSSGWSEGADRGRSRISATRSPRPRAELTPTPAAEPRRSRIERPL